MRAHFLVLQKSCVSLILGGNDWESGGAGWAQLQSNVDGPVTSAERTGADFTGIIRNQVWISKRELQQDNDPKNTSGTEKSGEIGPRLMFSNGRPKVIINPIRNLWPVLKNQDMQANISSNCTKSIFRIQLKHLL